MKNQMFKVIKSNRPTTMLEGGIVEITGSGVLGDGQTWNNYLSYSGDTLYKKWESFWELEIELGYMEFKLIEDETILQRIMRDEFGIEDGDMFNIERLSCNPYTFSSNSFIDKYGCTNTNMINFILTDKTINIEKVKPKTSITVTLSDIAKKFEVDDVIVIFDEITESKDKI